MTNLKNILYLPLVFLFLPAFGFLFPALGSVYLYFYIVLYISIILVCINDFKGVVTKTRNLIEYTPFKYFLLCWVSVIIISFINAFLGMGSLIKVFRSTTMQIILNIFPTILYFAYVIDKHIAYKKMFNIFVFLFWINLIIGFIAFLAELLNIELITNIFDFFANARLFDAMSFGQLTGRALSGYQCFGLPRLDNLFEEPSFYAKFLFLFLPITYAFANSNVCIVKNKYTNKFIKNTLIPFTWISIILTFSPIYLILSVLLTILLYWSSIIFFIKKHFKLIIFFIFILISFILITLKSLNIDFSETYLSRIINVLANVRSVNDLILIEPSLGTRIANYINLIIIWLKHPFTGVGFGNVAEFMYKQLPKSPVILTQEMIQFYKISSITLKNFHYNTSYIYELLACSGCIITLFFLYFVYQIFNKLRIIKQIYQCKRNDLTYCNALWGCTIAATISLFYATNFIYMGLNFIFALQIAFIYRNKLIINDKEEEVTNA